MITRRHFIRNSALALPAFSLAGFLLSSCRKTELEPDKKKPKIGIIGAGIAGLQAAKILSEQYHYEVELLEAGDRIGGRIMSEDRVFGAYPIELGASAVYGDDNVWYRMLNQNISLNKLNEGSASSYFMGGDSLSNIEISTDQEYLNMQQKLHEMIAFSSTADITVAQYIEMQAIPERVKFIFEEISEEMIGTSVDRASLKRNANEGLDKMNYSKFLPGQSSFHQVLIQNYGNILPYVLTNTPVVEVDYSADKVRITDSNQKLREYDHVIVTVPLSILKIKKGGLNGISFVPDLPESKRTAMDQLGMDSGVRIVLKLNRKFWHHDSKTIYTKGIFGKFEVIKENLISNHFIVACTVSGEMAENCLDMKSETEIIQMLKNEWTQNIGMNAANAISGYRIKYWSKDPYIRGTFSYHKVGSNDQTRSELAQQVSNKLFFAGEACHTGNKSGTVNGAMETAELAVEKIAKLYV